MAATRIRSQDVGDGQVLTADIADSQVTFAKLQTASSPGLEDSTGIRVKANAAKGVVLESAGVGTKLGAGLSFDSTGQIYISSLAAGMIAYDATTGISRNISVLADTYPVFTLAHEGWRELSSDPGSPNLSDAWFNTTDDLAKWKAAVGTVFPPVVLFASNADSTASVANSAAEQDFDSNSQFTFPANTLLDESIYRIRMSGRYRADSGNITLRVYIGAGSTSVTVTPVALNNATATWRADFEFTVNTVGASASLSGYLEFRTTGAASAQTSAAMTVNTTTTATMKVSAQFSASDGDHAMSIHWITMERLK